MITTFENFSYNEGASLNKEMIDSALKHIKKVMPTQKFISYIKKYKNKLKWLINHFTNGKDTIYTNRLLFKNEGFKDTWIYELFIEPFANWSYNNAWDRVAAGGVWFLALLLGVLIYIMGLMIYLNFFYTPMERGVVQNTEYVAAAWVMVPTTISNGKTTTIIYNNVYIPAHYNVEVKEVGNTGKEVWSTYDTGRGSKVSQGDTISWDDALYNVEKEK